jgi:hypothetical protein
LNRIFADTFRSGLAEEFQGAEKGIEKQKKYLERTGKGLNGEKQHLQEGGKVFESRTVVLEWEFRLCAKVKEQMHDL